MANLSWSYPSNKLTDPNVIPRLYFGNLRMFLSANVAVT